MKQLQHVQKLDRKPKKEEIPIATMEMIEKND